MREENICQSLRSLYSYRTKQKRNECVRIESESGERRENVKNKWGHNDTKRLRITLRYSLGKPDFEMHETAKWIRNVYAQTLCVWHREIKIKMNANNSIGDMWTRDVVLMEPQTQNYHTQSNNARQRTTTTTALLYYIYFDSSRTNENNRSSRSVRICQWCHTGNFLYYPDYAGHCPKKKNNLYGKWIIKKKTLKHIYLIKFRYIILYFPYYPILYYILLIFKITQNRYVMMKSNCWQKKKQKLRNNLQKFSFKEPESIFSAPKNIIYNSIYVKIGRGKKKIISNAK